MQVLVSMQAYLLLPYLQRALAAASPAASAAVVSQSGSASAPPAVDLGAIIGMHLQLDSRLQMTRTHTVLQAETHTDHLHFPAT